MKHMQTTPSSIVHVCKDEPHYNYINFVHRNGSLHFQIQGRENSPNVLLVCLDL